MEVGKVCNLIMVKKTDFGIYLSENQGDEEKVLLPKKEVPEGINNGDKVEVFIYRDSDDRLIATTSMPKVIPGELGVLEVMDVTRIGAFLDMGLAKEILLPFKEQIRKINVGDKVLVSVYVDKSDRLCATMKINKYLSCESPYKKDDKVRGVIINVNPDMGAYIAVDMKYHGMIPKREIHTNLKSGDEIEARVTSVRDDGKLNLSMNDKAYVQIDADALKIKDIITDKGGVLNFDDKAAPEVIEKEFGISKAAFKRAVGRLLKNEIIEKADGKIKIK